MCVFTFTPIIIWNLKSMEYKNPIIYAVHYLRCYFLILFRALGIFVLFRDKFVVVKSHSFTSK